MSSLISVNNLISGVVSIPMGLTNKVEALCWDITLGTAGTGLGQLILSKTSSSADMVPDAVDHVGIIVYGYLYEYGDLGILKNPVPMQSQPKSKYPVFSLRSREVLGDTEVPMAEFEKWVQEMSESEFRGSSYNVTKRSCVTWGIKACEFLQVGCPDNWEKICNWATENKKVAGIIGKTGVHVRQVQLKAQAAETPKRIKNYIKAQLNLD